MKAPHKIVGTENGKVMDEKVILTEEGKLIKNRIRNRKQAEPIAKALPEIYPIVTAT